MNLNTCLFFLLTLIFPVHGIIAQTRGNEEIKPVLTIDQAKEIRLPDVKILSAEYLNEPGERKKPFCRILGVIGREINFELLLPETWNGRFVMGGGGGFVGSIQNMARDRVHEGFTTAGTDTGHEGPGIKADWAYNHLERQVNFGHAAIHRTAEVAEAIQSLYYGSFPVYSYFIGCSRGGGQAMMEAQRYPEDFDGIIAGAPAFSWPELGSEFIQNMQYLYPMAGNTEQPVVTKANLKLLQEMILDQCDVLDGVNDGIMNDPRDCTFDLDFLPECPDDNSSDDCFTLIQIEAIQAIYAGTFNQRGEIYPGFPFGGENDPWGWHNWIVGPYSGTAEFKFPSLQYGFGTETFKYLVFNDPEWDYLSYDLSGFEKDTRLARSNLNATNTDYAAFRDLGGKMIIYHGWSDAALSALSTIDHLEKVKDGDPEVDDYLRLFLLPGVLHCGGGPGPDQADWLRIIMDWVEKGRAPDKVVMSKISEGKTTMARPVFPYPRKAVYDGKGNPDVEGSYR
ncbi:MAG: tannase/feruloyl esterase family alpha/beta hydrolase [Cyclobacteriaceae bacterium]|nr:tannase/feruloyl esterase family alpha/beta hydrolase [Cyclobacteriaceae bacterium]